MAAKSSKQHTAKRSTQSTRRSGRSLQRSRGIAAKNVTSEDARFIQEHAEGLSKTTQRAKWIHAADEHEDRPGESLATRSHEVIQRWAEERDAKPATVPGSEHGDRVGILQFDFPGFGGEGLQQIGWEEWFKPFDERGLVFVFQEHKADGNLSNFFKLDSPEREDG